MICAGIDAGSRTTKVVLLDGASREVLAAGVVDQGIEQDALAESLLDRLLQENGIDRGRLGPVVATGYGRKLIRVADATITEITCQAWGVRQAHARGADHHRHRRTRQQALAASMPTARSATS